MPEKSTSKSGQGQSSAKAKTADKSYKETKATPAAKKTTTKSAGK